MTKHQLIADTFEAGGEYRGQYDLHQFTSEELQRFAAAIRAATKEEDAKICESEPERKRGDGIWACDQKACAEAIRASK